VRAELGQLCKRLQGTALRLGGLVACTDSDRPLKVGRSAQEFAPATAICRRIQVYCHCATSLSKRLCATVCDMTTGACTLILVLTPLPTPTSPPVRCVLVFLIQLCTAVDYQERKVVDCTADHYNCGLYDVDAAATTTTTTTITTTTTTTTTTNNNNNKNDCDCDDDDDDSAVDYHVHCCRCCVYNDDESNIDDEQQYKCAECDNDGDNNEQRQCRGGGSERRSTCSGPPRHHFDCCYRGWRCVDVCMWGVRTSFSPCLGHRLGLHCVSRLRLQARAQQTAGTRGATGRQHVAVDIGTRRWERPM
jgi:hypothetical protein